MLFLYTGRPDLAAPGRLYLSTNKRTNMSKSDVSTQKPIPTSRRDRRGMSETMLDEKTKLKLCEMPEMKRLILAQQSIKQYSSQGLAAVNPDWQIYSDIITMLTAILEEK